MFLRNQTKSKVSHRSPIVVGLVLTFVLSASAHNGPPFPKPQNPINNYLNKNKNDVSKLFKNNNMSSTFFFSIFITIFILFFILMVFSLLIITQYFIEFLNQVILFQLIY